jgi:hypothetical protein
MPKNNRTDLFVMGEALLEKKVAGRSTLFAQRMKGKSFVAFPCHRNEEATSYCVLVDIVGMFLVCTL